MHLSQMWQEFKSYAAVEIGVPHSKPLMNSRFHFLIIVSIANFQVLLQ
jgi:hypothetical protein